MGTQTSRSEFHAGSMAQLNAEPIAIIGLACRVPGAKNAEEFWRLLRAGRDATREVPADRWDTDAYYDPDASVPGKMNVRRGAFLDNIDLFDPYFFGISPREALHMDPQQRLLCEVTWEALEHAGIRPNRLSGSRTGVFIGISGFDYSVAQTKLNDPCLIDAYSVSGNAHSIAANRLSYLLDLRGPSFPVDTACSSSLIALHLACQSLRRGESSLAITGGVNLILEPAVTGSAAKARMLAPDGRCKTFDAAADGYGRGEGCGVLILKRLADARRDGDNILACVRGTATNQDGRTPGIMVPNQHAQEAVIREALADGAVSPEQIGYIEAHGTGTPVGDPIEVAALAAVLKTGRRDGQPCVVGAVKANIGHLEPAAGVMSVIKAVLCLLNEEIPPQMSLRQLNPRISLQGTPLVIPTALVPWPRGPMPRFAGVNSFGFGGANAHVVLEEAPVQPPPRNLVERPLHLLCLSAQTDNALRSLARAYDDHLAAHADVALADVCFTASTGRSHFAHRLAVTAASAAELRARLGEFAAGAQPAGIRVGQASPTARPKIAFLFTGQGSQYVGMGRRLYDTQPTFRRILDRCDEILRPHLGKSLLSILYSDTEDPGAIHETMYTQPALFAIEYALAELWRSWGLTPDAVLGHSIGEYVAACVAGVFSLEDGLNLIAERARLMQSLARDGTMAVVSADEATVGAAIAPYADRVSIAAVNGPRNTVISGRTEAIQVVRERFESTGVVSRTLAVSHAFHSPLMEPVLDAFERIISQVRFATPRISLVSNLTGKALGEPLPDGHYWRRHMREAVRFADGITTLAEKGCQMFVELGPHPTLIGMGRQCVRDPNAAWLPALRQGEDDWQVLLDTAGALYVAGIELDWEAVDRDRQPRRVPLPTYPFERQRYWFPQASPAVQRTAGPSSPNASRHPLLGVRLSTGLPIFESRLGIGTLPYLQDHCIQGIVVLPGTAYLEMGLAAAAEALGAGPRALTDVAFERALILPEETARTIQVALIPDESEETTLRIISHGGEAADGEGSWTLHTRGKVRARVPDSPSGEQSSGQQESLDEIRARCADEVPALLLYQGLAERGFLYGPAFRGLERVWRRNGEALAAVRLPEALEPDAARYHVHPALLDACFHALAGAVPAEEQGARSGIYIPTGLRSIWIDALGDRQLVYSHALLRSAPEADGLEADLRLLDDTGRLVGEVRSLRLQSLRQPLQPAEAMSRGWLYELRWIPKPLPAGEDTPSAAVRPGGWLLLTDTTGCGERLAALLEARGDRCVMVRPGEGYAIDERGWYCVNPGDLDEFRRLLRETSGPDCPPCRGMIHLWSLDADRSDDLTLASLDQAQLRGCISALRLVQAAAGGGWLEPPRVWFVTRGAQAVDAEPDELAVAQSALWGLGRVSALEHAELKPTMVDLDPRAGDDAALVLIRELYARDRENQIAFRSGTRYGARFVPITPEAGPAEAVDPSGGEPATRRGTHTTGLAIPTGEAFRLAISTPGTLDNLVLVPTTRREPVPSEVEIEICAAGLNFADVLRALGVYPGADANSPLGLECAGRVLRVGADVDGVRPGDEVIALAAFSFGSIAYAPAAYVMPKPAQLSFEEAATVPVGFLTAYYALHHLARLSSGERVLIHAATGGVGLAAVQLVQRAGGEIFATAGSPEKRAYLQSLGIQHVMDSRSLAFAEDVMRQTNGEGVDIVLNSLGGEYIAKSLETLRPFGRFLELGKVDIYQNTPVGLRPFAGSLSYSSIDLDRLSVERSALTRALLLEIVKAFDEGTLKPLPLRVFPIEDAVAAFRYMAQRRHIGKIVLSLPARRPIASPAAPPAQTAVTVRADATYLITGGLGGLGLGAAACLVKAGARHLALLGRRAPGSMVRDALDALERTGIQVAVLQADVTRPEEVARCVGYIRESMPPLRGIIHAAGVLDDGVLLRLTPERFATVMGPKLHGAWNLHSMTSDLSLDFFVLFSSIASLFGSPGQGNYAAANAFLDALACYRRARGRPALSINWGPWAEVGMAARPDRRRHLEARGLRPIVPAQGFRLFQLLLAEDRAQVAVIAANWPQLLASYRTVGVPPLFSELRWEMAAAPSRGRTAHGRATLTREELLDVEPSRRQQLLESYFKVELAHITGFDPARLEPHLALASLGLDSLMVFELVNDLESRLGIVFPMAKLTEDMRLVDVFALILEQLSAGPPPPSHQPDAPKAAA